MVEKIEFLRKKYKNLDIGVDGGINCETIEIVAKAGVNYVVAGNGVFKHKDPKFAINFMRETIQKYLE